MLCAHLRYPILAVSTTHRRVGVACVGHDLELLDARLREFRHHRELPVRAEYVRAFVTEMRRAHGARTLIVDGHDQELSADNASIVGMLRRAGRTRTCSVLVGSFSDALEILGARTPADCVRSLAERHEIVRERLQLADAFDRPSARRYLENRPLIVAVALAHAAGLASLTAEATQLSMPT